MRKQGLGHVPLGGSEIRALPRGAVPGGPRADSLYLAEGVRIPAVPPFSQASWDSLHKLPHGNHFGR